MIVNYIAIEECMLLILYRTDFMKIMAENPDLIDEMKLVAKENDFNYRENEDGSKKYQNNSLDE